MAKRKARFDVRLVHPLAEAGKLAGKIEFIHFRDNKVHTFWFCTNSMTQTQFKWFDREAPTEATDREIMTTVRDIYNKSNGVVSHIGDITPAARMVEMSKKLLKETVAHAGLVPHLKKP